MFEYDLNLISIFFFDIRFLFFNDWIKEFISLFSFFNDNPKKPENWYLFKSIEHLLIKIKKNGISLLSIW